LTKITPAFRSYRQAAFAGWFGPIGVGAVFFCELALEEAENDGPHNSRGIQVIRPVVFFLVLSSVIVHGITVPLLLIGKAVHTRTMSISSNNVLSQVVSRLSFANSREPNFQEHTIQISEPPVNMHKPGPVGGGQVNDSHSAIFNIPFERTITIDEAPRVSRHEVDFHNGSYDDGMLGMSRSDGEAKISHNSSHETTLNNVSGEPNSSMKQGRFLPPHMHNSNLDRQQRRWSTAAENYSGHGNVFFEGQQLPMHSRSMSQLHSTTLSPLVALRADQERAKSSPSVQGGRELRQQNSRRSDEIVELPNGELALYDDPYDLESERAFMENRYIENPIRIINRWVSNRAGHIRGLFLRRGNPRHTDNNNNSNNSGRPT
ncbi:Na+/H+ antiporter, partial [Spiromyces aspiralis]